MKLSVEADADLVISAPSPPERRAALPPRVVPIKARRLTRLPVTLESPSDSMIFMQGLCEAGIAGGKQKHARCSGRTCDLSPRRPVGEVKKREAAQTCNFQFLRTNSKSQRA